MKLVHYCTVIVFLLGAQTANSAEPMSGTASKLLIGKWNLDTAAMLKQMEEKAATDEDRGGVELVKQLLGTMQMQMEFTAEGTMAVSMKGLGQEESKKGTYKVKSDKKNSLVVSGTMDGRTQEVHISFPDTNVMHLTVPEEESPLSEMVFIRANKSDDKEP